jgi:hypothetical protein
VRLAHTILRRPLIADTTQFRFRALVPLRGQLSSQYLADFALVATDARRKPMRIERDTYSEPIARSLNVTACRRPLAGPRARSARLIGESGAPART